MSGTYMQTHPHVPAPRLVTTSMGQPQFKSMKSVRVYLSRSCAVCDRMSLLQPVVEVERLVCVGVEGIERSQTHTHRHTPAIWIPNTSSCWCLFNKAHSLLWPPSTLKDMAISPQVMSAPKSFSTRRKGRLPTVVSGAMYTLFEKSTKRTFSGSGLLLTAPSAEAVGAVTCCM